jgi:hypothetical protein
MHASAREQASCCSLHLPKVSLLLTIVVKVYVLPLLRFFCCERLSAGVSCAAVVMSEVSLCCGVLCYAAGVRVQCWPL